MISRMVSTASVDFFLVNPFCSTMASIKWDLVRVMVGSFGLMLVLLLKEHESGAKVSFFN